jgi:hypothetical protein
MKSGPGSGAGAAQAYAASGRVRRKAVDTRSVRDVARLSLRSGIGL